MSVSLHSLSQDPSSGVQQLPLLARARYNNVAEVADELSFRQGDVGTVLRKDYNGQVDWWLCEMRGRVGMVPANYFEVFHDSEATYDVPRSASTPVGGRRSRSTDPLEDDDEVLYDFPPPLERRPGDEGPDYDLPPEPGSTSLVPLPEGPDYDCPPMGRPGSARSSQKSATGILLHRLSQTSASSGGTSGGSQIYDVPPAELAEVYDLPKVDQPAKGFEDEERGQTLMAVDIGQILDDEAEEMLGSYCKLVTVTYENLFQTVYGTEAYWGTDNMPRRNDTLQMTIHAGKQFDRALTALLEFGKGVANSLESSHDTNFKKKYGSHYRGLLQRRNEILPKLEALPLNNETTTATVKSLLEVARVVPNAVNEFAVLVRVNKAVLFTPSRKPGADSLPVLTKSEVKVRPLPDLPPTPPFQRDSRSSGYDYAYIPSDEQELPPPRPPKSSDEGSDCSPSHVTRHTPPLPPSSPSRHMGLKSDSDSSVDSQGRKRNPQDHLPPLPYATVPRSPKRAPPVQTNSPSTPVRGQSPTHTPVRGRSPTNIFYTPVRGQSPTHSRRDLSIVNGRHSPVSVGDFIGHRQRSNCVVSSSRGTSPLRSSPLHRPTHKRNQSYDSNLSETSSCDLNEGVGFRRVRSNDLLDGPYGRATTPSHQPYRSGSPQQLRREERELLERFSKQMELITPSLRESVDVLLDSITVSETPKEFVTKSKLAVVAAYKLVYVADALCQKILHNETKTSILSSSNLLTESIKALVSDTKSAALQYPSVLALEKMGESLKIVLPSALDLLESVKSRATHI